MKITYLSYNQGFQLHELLQVISENKIDIDIIYLSALMINPIDLAKFSEELFEGIPLQINESIGEGFSEESLRWMKEHIRFQDMKEKKLFLEKKISGNGIHFITFTVKDEQTGFLPGRGRFEHIDSQMVMVEVSIDDMNPEFYGYIMEGLFSLGVNDVYVNPVLMKKNRPGQIIHVLCQEEIRGRVINFLFKETTTLGVRYTPYHVHRLERDFVKVETKWGFVNIKVGIFKGEIVQIAPEFSDCQQLANKHNVALKIIYEEAKSLGNKLLNK